MILGCTLKKIARLASLAAGGAPNMVEYGTSLHWQYGMCLPTGQLEG